MIKINTKEFLHNFAKYKAKVKSGERVVVCEFKKPILDVTPYEEKINKSGWKRNHYILPKGKTSAVKALIKERHEAKY